MDSTSEEQDDSIVSEQDTMVLVNNPPSVLTPAVVSMDWTGENATLSGFVTDEVPQNTSLSVRMLDLNFAELTAYNMTPALDGAWTVETSLHDPGEWIVELIAVDDEQQVSERILIELIIVAPIEPQVTFTFRWDEPVENETNGTLSGLVLHQFPASCTVEYHPLGQSPALLVAGQINESTGAYNIIVNTESHNTEGDIISECGIFNQTDLTVRVALPMPPEPVGDADGDAVLDDADQCPSTPEGEPVYSTGCSDSETDDDEDGIMNDMDACPNTMPNESVDANGCSQSQLDDDNDGVNNAADLCPQPLQTRLLIPPDVHLLNVIVTVIPLTTQPTSAPIRLLGLLWVQMDAQYLIGRMKTHSSVSMDKVHGLRTSMGTETVTRRIRVVMDKKVVEEVQGLGSNARFRYPLHPRRCKSTPMLFQTTTGSQHLQQMLTSKVNPLPSLLSQ